jgi:2-polyprenyl-6-methoxyphenol hydroxylase-like FAD-dependent oxidoreductase
MQPRIAIIGAGPAGLTMGLLLHQRAIPFTIFELRPKPTPAELAEPSGMLDLHQESGIAAIKECGLYEDFLARTGECSEAQRVSDKDGNILYEDQGEHSSRPEISRHALTGLLLAGLPAESVQWEHKLLSASSSASSSGHATIELDFGPRGKHAADFVVGADGAWSRVRALLTDVRPMYAGTVNVNLTIRDMGARHPRLAELVGTGSFAALAGHHGVMSHRGSRDSARIYVMLSAADEAFARTSGLAGRPPAEVRARLVGEGGILGGWGPRVKELVEAACEDEERADPRRPADVRPLYRLPVGAAWEPRRGATLVGDAAHLACPWAGEGVNLAMWDSLLLARAVAEAHASVGGDAAGGEEAFQRALDPAVATFEAHMVARARGPAEEALRNGEMLFGSEHGARAFADFFRQFGPAAG